MSPRPICRAALTMVAAASLTAACGVAPSSGPSGAPTGPPDSIGSTAAPTESARATAIPVASPPSTQPPTASLAAEGGDPVAGQLGSYTWLDGGSDSPWLPGAPLSVGAGEPLTVTLGDAVAVADWSARQVPAGTTNGTGAAGLGGGGPPIAFAAPGTGIWSVQVTVRFGADLGSATYYWRLAVP